jgi:hypothetical protein
MKRFISWTFVILLTFALGIVATVMWFNYYSSITLSVKESISEDLPILAYCELVNNPEKYDGKTVRLRAEVKTGNHGQYLWDSICPGDEKIKTYYEATAAVIFNNIQDQEKIKQIRDARKPFLVQRWTDLVNITAVGKFKKNKPTEKSSGLVENSTFHFEIIKLESVSDIDD